MAYEMTELLQKCERCDIEFIVETLDSYVNLTDDAGMKQMLKTWISGPVPVTFARKLEEEIRYVGSSDIAYFARKVTGGEAGVSVNEIIDDIASMSKVKLKTVCSIEGKLEHLAKAIAEKKFFELPPEKQAELLRQNKKITERDIQSILDAKTNTSLLFPLLIKLLGPEMTISLLKGLLVTILSQFVTKEVAKQLITQLFTKIPWFGQILGPIAWATSAGLLAVNVTGEAYRKTVPIMFMLALVSLRDGPEEGDAFWTTNP